MLRSGLMKRVLSYTGRATMCLAIRPENPRHPSREIPSTSDAQKGSLGGPKTSS